MDRNTMLIIGAIALIGVLAFTSAGSIFQSGHDDPYYDYSHTYSYDGSQIQISNRITEKSSLPLTNCIDKVPPKYGSTYPNCRSYTYFNARSFRIEIDGKERYNAYSYPDLQLQDDFALSSPWSGSIRSNPYFDANSADTGALKPYLYDKFVDAHQTLSGTTEFTIKIAPELAPGNHTIDVYYFATSSNYEKDNIYSGIPANYNAMGGSADPWGGGDHNKFYNQRYSFQISVAGAEQPQINTTTNQTQNTTQGGTATQGGTGTQGGIAQQPSAFEAFFSQYGLIGIIAATLAAIAALKLAKVI